MSPENVARRLVEEFKQEVIPPVGEKVVEFWQRRGGELTPIQWIEVLSLLLSITEHKLWFGFFEEKFVELVSAEPEFIQLVENYVTLHEGFALGLANALHRIGREKPRLAKQLYILLNSLENSWVVYYCGVLLGAIGESEKDWFLDHLEILWTRADAFSRTAALRGICLAYYQENKNLPESIIRKLNEVITPGMAPLVRGTALQICFLLYRLDSMWFSNLILELVVKGPFEVKLEIAQNLVGTKLGDPTIEMKILELLVKERDPHILRLVVLYLAESGATLLDRKMAIIKTIIDNEMHWYIPFEWGTERLGQHNPLGILSIVDSWISRKIGASLRFELPRLVVRMVATKPNQLLTRIKTWLLSDDIHRGIAIDAFKELLTAIYYGLRVSKAWRKRAQKILAEAVKRRGFDPTPILHHKFNDSIRSLMLVEKLETRPINVDFRHIEHVLTRYPNISHFFDSKWIADMERQDSVTYEILELVMLAHPIKTTDDWAAIPHIQGFLQHLEMMLGEVSFAEDEFNSVRRKIRNPTEFYSSLSELELLSVFRQAGFTVRVEPKIGRKTLDLSVVIDGEELLFEIVNPKRFLELKYLKRPITIPNRVKAILLRKLSKQLKQVLNQIKTPIILAIDASRSEIDLESVVAALFGSLAVTWTKDPITNEVGETYLTRTGDHIHHEEPATDVWSAVLYYRSSVAPNGSVQYEAHLIENAFASRRLSKSCAKSIIEAYS